jgi:hypothetical protein
MTDLTKIHIRWNNEQDLLLTVSLSKDSISSIKQRVNYKVTKKRGEDYF